MRRRRWDFFLGMEGAFLRLYRPPGKKGSEKKGRKNFLFVARKCATFALKPLWV